MLNSVSETAIITLKSRVMESKKNPSIFKDEMGEICYKHLILQLDDDLKERMINVRTSAVLTRHLALRARRYDQYVKEFLSRTPGALVVSLGCGLDTRFWRLKMESNQYIELDLPEIIDFKKELLVNEIDYMTIGKSVLDLSWIEEVSKIQKENVLFIAEGLFMYLEQDDVITLLRKLADAFSASSLLMEVVNKKYTKGFNKKMVEMKMRRSLNSDAGTSYNFGLESGREIEAFHKKFKLKEEWSYFEDDDIKPHFLKMFRRWKMFTRTQWSIFVDIN